MAIEDERFYEHNGIDIQGILRAGVVGVMNGFDFTEGASTLTQQLIKNNVFDFVNEKTFLTEWNVNYKSSISLSHLKKR